MHNEIHVTQYTHTIPKSFVKSFMCWRLPKQFRFDYARKYSTWFCVSVPCNYYLVGKCKIQIRHIQCAPLLKTIDVEKEIGATFI